VTNFDSVEKLRERANVSYEDARAALEASNGDLLEALILLEKQGKVAPPAGGGSYSSRRAPEPQRTGGGPGPEKPGYSFSELLNRFFSWCGRLLHAGNTNQFEVFHKGRRIIGMPVTLLVLMLLFACWVTLPLLVVGLFLSCRYAFSGGAVNVNDVMDSAANAAEGIKSEIRQAQQSARENQDGNG
jgi:hypothetical protein